MPDNELDQMLERSLARYSAVEPLAGLEERVLARIHSGPKRATAKVPLWAVGVLCFSTMLAIGLVFLPRSGPEINGARNRDLAAELPITIPQQRFSFTLPAGPVKASRRPLPKQSSFPLATPATQGEKALVELANYSPGVLLNLDKTADPIQIVPIQIKPIDDSNQEQRSPNVE